MKGKTMEHTFTIPGYHVECENGIVRISEYHSDGTFMGTVELSMNHLKAIYDRANEEMK